MGTSLRPEPALPGDCVPAQSHIEFLLVMFLQTNRTKGIYIYIYIYIYRERERERERERFVLRHWLMLLWDLAGLKSIGQLNRL